MGLLANVCFYVFVIYYVGRAYFYFRKTGGIKGLNPVHELPEERAARRAGKIAKKGAEMLEDRIDGEAAKEKLLDLEHQNV